MAVFPGTTRLDARVQAAARISPKEATDDPKTSPTAPPTEDRLVPAKVAEEVREDQSQVKGAKKLRLQTVSKMEAIVSCRRARLELPTLKSQVIGERWKLENPW